MGWPEIRAAVVGVLEGVDGIGAVHAYTRWANDWQKVLAALTSGGRVNAWMVGRTAMPQRWLTNIEFLRVHEIEIIGFHSLDDSAATEHTFNAIIDAIVTAFNANDTLSGACETITPELGSLANLGGVQVERIDTRQLSKILCHACRLRLGAQVRGTR